MISKQERDEAEAAEVVVHPVEDVFHEFAPYFVEQVRKDVVERIGNARLLNDGLKIFTTMDSERQRAAQDSVLDNLLTVDKRQGFRGPVAELKTEAERKAFIAEERDRARRREDRERQPLRRARHRGRGRRRRWPTSRSAT